MSTASSAKRPRGALAPVKRRRGRRKRKCLGRRQTGKARSRDKLRSRFADPHAWWMHAMVALWLAFAAMLFVVEPLHLHRRMAESPDPARDFARIERLHRVALATVAAAVAGSHGWAF